MTHSSSIAVHRKLRDQTSFSFCLESDWAGGAKVDRAGRGLALVWRRQIQQLNRVSLDMASAIVDTYPSPQLLVQVGCSSQWSPPAPCASSGLPVSMEGTGSQQCRPAEISEPLTQGQRTASHALPQAYCPLLMDKGDPGWHSIKKSFATFRLTGGVSQSKNARICSQTYRCAAGKA